MKRLKRGLSRMFLVLAIGSCLLGSARSAQASSTGSISGVLVVRAPPEKTETGLRPGDVLFSWFRPANPPSNPQPSAGLLRSPLDFGAILQEQRRRGAILLWGKRGSKDMMWVLPFGDDSGINIPDVVPNLASYHITYRNNYTYDCGEWCGYEAAVAQAKEDVLLSAWFLEKIHDEVSLKTASAMLAQAGEPLLAARPLSFWCATLAIHAAPEAEECREQVLKIVHAASPGSLREAFSLRQIAELKREAGNIRAAEELSKRAQGIEDAQIPQTPWSIARRLEILADEASSQGDYSAAEKFLLRAIDSAQALGPESPRRAWLMEKLGDLYAALGRLYSAELSYKSALTIDEKIRDERGENGAYIEDHLRKLGMVEAARGNLAAADEHLQKALALARKVDVPGASYINVPIILKELAAIEIRRGDLNYAQLLLQRVSEALSSALLMDPFYVIINGYSGDPKRIITRELNSLQKTLATLSEQRGDRPQAEWLLRQAILKPSSESPVFTKITETFILQARLKLLIGDLVAARNLLQQARSRLERQAPKSLTAADILMALGEVARQRGRVQEAIAHYRHALAIRQKLNPMSFDEAQALAALGAAESWGARIAEGARHLCRAVDVLESQRSSVGGVPEARSLFEASTGGYHQACLEALLRLGQAQEAFHALERSRARSFLNLLADRDLRFSELPPELAAERRRLDTQYDQFQAELAKQTPGKDAAAIDRLQGQIYELRTRQEAILNQIRAGSPHLTSVQAPTPLDLARTRSALDPGSLLLSYSVGEKKTFLFVVRPAGSPGSGLSVYTLRLGKKALRERIEAFRNVLEQRNSDRQALAVQARRLYDLLLRPAERQIAAADRLIVSSDGPLHSLSFAALRRQGQYLAEWKPIHTVLSATVYAEIRKSRPAAQDPLTETVAAFGDPLYPTKGKGLAERLADPEVRDAARGYDFAPLPSTRDEVEGIAKLFPQSQIFLGADATEERAKQVSPKARILHFACHGFLNDRFPLNSGLALTLPDKPAEGQDNGLLQAWEIFENVRLDADLVTLSACNTALGQEMGGEGLVGLTRAFQYAGARSVVASLWSVADASTSELMKRFYTHLREGQTKDEALRQAQADLIHSADPALAHPYHWAAFQLFGDWQ